MKMLDPNPEWALQLVKQQRKVLSQLGGWETAHSNNGFMKEKQVAHDHIFMNLLNMLTAMSLHR